jgi:hypothetical protein
LRLKLLFEADVWKRHERNLRRSARICWLCGRKWDAEDDAGGRETQSAPGAEIREVKIPEFGRTDVLVSVKVASICGTDLHIYEWDRWAQGRIHLR